MTTYYNHFQMGTYTITTLNIKDVM